MSSSIVPVPIQSDDDRWISIVRNFSQNYKKIAVCLIEKFD